MNTIELSVVTRTRNRLLFLKRAAQSIKSAAPRGTEWIIVNDGGDVDGIERLMDTLKAGTDIEIRLFSTSHQGRGAAANVGLAHARGTYFHVHDDDDTIDPDFYRETIGFLESNSRFGGVCTLTTRIEEEVRHGRIGQIRRSPHNPELTAVTFAKLATSFLFPPISFLARTTCCREVGEFDTATDIPEDYDFDLRFLAKFDIGVIRRELSFVHQRRTTVADNSDDWAHAPASMDIQTYNAVLRNKYFRRDIESGTVGLGWLLVMGELSEPSRKLDIVVRALANIRLARWLGGMFR